MFQLQKKAAHMFGSVAPSVRPLQWPLRRALNAESPKKAKISHVSKSNLDVMEVLSIFDLAHILEKVFQKMFPTIPA